MIVTLIVLLLISGEWGVDHAEPGLEEWLCQFKGRMALDLAALRPEVENGLSICVPTGTLQPPSEWIET